MNIETLIEALEKELAGYVRRGLAQRAKDVETELRRLGWSPNATAGDVVPSESASTPQKPSKAPRKPAEKPKASEAPKPRSRKK